jgi:predicted permease
MATFIRDFSYSVRMLSKRPGFTAAAVAVLALGIGANTAIFTLVNGFLLRPLLIREPDRLAGCYSRDTRKPGAYRAFSYPNYADLRDRNPVFTNLAAHNMAMVGLAEGDSTRRVFADMVSSNYFETFGVPLWRGRAFTAAEERPGSGAAVAIVSYPYWKKTGADSQFLGKTVRLNGRLFTVVGIAAEGFSGSTALLSPEVYVPLGVYESLVNDFAAQARPLAARDNHSLILIGRLRPGVSPAAADRQLVAVGTSMEQAYPAINKDQGLVVRPLSRMSISTSPQNDGVLAVPAALLLSMAAVVLLIASLNVANMMLARGTARRKEIAIRLALGGGRARIVQQLLTEGMLLAALGGLAGLAVSYWGTTLLTRSLAQLAPFDLLLSAVPDVRVLAATMGFCLLSTVLFGFGPAWNLSRPDLVSGLKAGDTTGALTGERGRLFSRRNLLVMTQVSLSLMLLTAAGLFVRSSMRAARIHPGFQLAGGILLEVDPSLAGYDEAHGRQVYRALLERLRGIPGVARVSIAATVPFGMISLGRSVQVGKAPAVAVTYNIVGDGYFETLGIPLLRGRSFQAGEMEAGSHPVAVIDQLTAGKLWPNGDAVGRHLRLLPEWTTPKELDLEVIGVVGSVRQHIVGQGVEPALYLAFGQQYQANMNVHVKTAAQFLEGGAPEGAARLIGAIRQEVRLVDARLPVIGLKTLDDHLESSFDIWIVRTGARMFAILGGVALLLAMIGLYGVRAYSVARRTREIGIRMALGASAPDTLWLVLREGLTLTAIGLGVGLLLALAVGRLLANMLFEVSGADALVFGTAGFLLTAVSLLACYFPARAAARVDPIVALRYE